MPNPRIFGQYPILLLRSVSFFAPVYSTPLLKNLTFELLAPALLGLQSASLQLLYPPLPIKLILLDELIRFVAPAEFEFGRRVLR